MPPSQRSAKDDLSTEDSSTASSQESSTDRIPVSQHGNVAQSSAGPTDQSYPAVDSNTEHSNVIQASATSSHDSTVSYRKPDDVDNRSSKTAATTTRIKDIRHGGLTRAERRDVLLKSDAPIFPDAIERLGSYKPANLSFMVQQPEETKLDDTPPSAVRSGSPSMCTVATAESLERLRLFGLGGEAESPQTPANEDNDNDYQPPTSMQQQSMPFTMAAGQGGPLPMLVYAMPYPGAAAPYTPMVPQPAHGEMESPVDLIDWMTNCFFSNSSK